tara:strand:+ start:812 stop:1312 length:501 start_codon:yes stop_codon:yes gene_type:complete
MSKKSQSSLFWNAHVKQMLIDGQRVIAAFETLKFSLAEARKPGLIERIIGIDRKEPETIEVPIWALREIADRWAEYEASQGSRSLGQVFGLEGSGRGKHRSIGRYRRAEAYVDYALEVTELVENGVSKNQAIATISQKHGIEADALRKALNPPKLPRADRGYPSAE